MLQAASFSVSSTGSPQTDVDPRGLSPDTGGIYWTQKESVKAKLRVIVKRILRKHGYPPDKQEAATTTVLEQAELLSENWLHGS